MPCSNPPLDNTSVPSAISALPPASRPDPGWRDRANRTADHAAPTNTTIAPSPLAAPGQRAGQHAEVVLADGDAGHRDRAVDRRREHHAERDAGEHEEHRAHPVADAAAEEQVDRAEREPRDVDHRAEEEERAERALVPAGGGAGRERGRGEGEERQGDRPGALVGRPRPGPAHGGRLGEHGGDRGGDEGETGDHGRAERTPEKPVRTLCGKAPPHFENPVTRSVP